MADTAVALVKRNQEKRSRLLIPTLHIAAGGLGGAFMGASIAILAAAAFAVGAPVRPFLICLLAFAAAVDLLRVSMRRLQPPAGVPGSWRAWSWPQAMATYGFLLGAGLLTPFTASATYALVALVGISADPGAGALIFGTYGATRAAAAMGVGLWRLRTSSYALTVALQQGKSRWRPLLGAVAALSVATVLMGPAH